MWLPEGNDQVNRISSDEGVISRVFQKVFDSERAEQGELTEWAVIHQNSEDNKEQQD